MKSDKYSYSKIKIWHSGEEKELKEFFVESFHDKKHVSTNFLKLIDRSL